MVFKNLPDPDSRFNDHKKEDDVNSPLGQKEDLRLLPPHYPPATVEMGWVEKQQPNRWQRFWAWALLGWRWKEK